MLRQDLPDNVIPFRPRNQSKSRSLRQTAAAEPRLSASRHATRLIPADNPAEPITSEVSASIDQVVDLTSAVAGMQRHAVSPQPSLPLGSTTTSGLDDSRDAGRRPMASMPSGSKKDDAARLQDDKVANNDDGPLTGGRQPPRRFSWRRLLLVLAVAFAVGVGIAWGAIAIGASIVNYWPHGFGLYIMLVGGGVTMMLTAALMTAVFYSDSSGHDAEVHQFQPDKPPRTSLRQ